MSLKNLLVILAALLLNSVPTILYADSQPVSDSTTTLPLKIGALLCLTGDCAEWGTNSLDGLTLAQEEINRDGGILGRKIELQVQDTKEESGGAGSVSAYRALRNDPSISLFVGPNWTTGGLSLGPIVAKDPVIITSPSLGVKEFNEFSDNIFNIWPHDEISTRELASYAFKKGWRKLAILSSQQPWSKDQGRIFQDAFTSLGGSITTIEEPLPSATDLRSEVLRIRATQPEAVFFTDYSSGLAIGARLLRQQGVKVPFLFPIEVDKMHIQAARGALEGLILAKYSPATNDFPNKFKKRFNHEPGVTADKAYDLLFLYQKAIAQAQTLDINILKKTLLTTRLNNASGAIEFDSNRSIVAHPQLYTIKGEDTVPLDALN